MDPTAELPRFNLAMGFVEDESLAESGRPSSLVWLSAWLGWVGLGWSVQVLVVFGWAFWGYFGGLLLLKDCSRKHLISSWNSKKSEDIRISEVLVFW